MAEKIAAFIDRLGITAEVTTAASNPNRDDLDAARDPGQRHWRVTLKFNGREYAVPFTQGSAWTRPPSVADVLDAVASDAAGFENARLFEDWAPEYGYDPDSRKAERVFRAVERQSVKLQRFLGDEEYQRLLWQTERE